MMPRERRGLHELDITRARRRLARLVFLFFVAVRRRRAECGRHQENRQVAQRLDKYTPLQELYLLRFARLVGLHHQYLEHAAPPDERFALSRWALHSTMVHGIRLNMGLEAERLSPARGK
jgi:hypothetical protein